MNRAGNVTAELTQNLKYLHLPTVRQCYEEVARQAERESLSYERYLHELVQRECEERQENRITKMLRESQLPLEKSLEAFDTKRLPAKAARQMRSLLDGSFLERTDNVLVFGNPGSGKTHMLQAISQELVRRGHRMLFTSCEMLVQERLIAKRDLKLSRLIKRYSRYEGMIIDDLGYIRQTREEMEVVFTLLAERYERGSVLLTSNLPFSKWEGIFKDPMTTAAAIDRLVHHSVIVELNVPSYRLEHPRHNLQAVDQETAAAPSSGEKIAACRYPQKENRSEEGLRRILLLRRKIYVNDIPPHLKVPLDSSFPSEGRVLASFIHKGLVDHNYVESLKRIAARHRP